MAQIYTCLHTVMLVLNNSQKQLYKSLLPIILFTVSQHAEALITVPYADGNDFTASFVTADDVDLQVTTGTATQSGDLTVNGGFQTDKVGAGTLILTGLGNFSGPTIISAGTLQLGASNRIADTSDLVINGGTFDLNNFDETVANLSGTSGNIDSGGTGSTFTVNQTVNGTYAGNFSGATNGFTLEKNGAATLTLSGTNSQTGNGRIQVNAGILQLQGGNAVGDNQFFQGAGTVELLSDETIGSTSLSAGGNLLLNANTLTINGNIGTFFSLDSSVISGTGNIIVNNGDDTQLFIGTNTYTGTTTINGGKVRLANGAAIVDAGAVIVNGGTLEILAAETIGSLAGTGGFVKLDTALTIGDATNTTYDGVVQGASSLTKQGSGTFTLSGNNTYLGGTTVSAGILQGTTTSLQGNILNNANVTFDQTTTGTYSDDISGTGSLTKTNTGTVILSGTNSYNGGTTISAGILQVSVDDQLGSGTLTMNGGTLRNTSVYTETNGAILNAGTTSTIDNPVSLGYSGIISGDGNLNKMGTGDLAFTGNNTYTGTTAISAGTLQIGSGGTTGSIVGDITNNSALIFNRSDALAYSGNITGTGSLTKLGTGTTTLTGAASHSGGTTITAGALQIGSGGTTGSATGDITNNSALIFNRSDAATFGDVISGTGSFTQSGTGSVNLTGTNTYNGATTINAGTLFVNGSNSASTTTVNTGGTLGGTGTVGTVNVAGGTFAPGNSIGTTNVAGNVDFSGGGVYQVEVDAAGNSDLINATGTATLTSGTVQVLPEAGTYNLTTDYTILTAAGGLGGTTFNSVTSNLAFLNPTLSYDANNVFLNLKRNDVSFTDVAGTPNQVAVSTLLTSLNNSNPAEFSTLLTTLFGLTAEGAQQAYDSLSGVQYTHGQVLTNKLSQQFAQLLFNRGSQNPNIQLSFNAVQQFDPLQGHVLADNSNNWETAATDTGSLVGHQRGWWLQGFGGFGDIDTTTNVSGADYDTQGLALGVDTEWRDVVVGLAGSYARSDADTFGGNLDVDSFQAATYASWQRDAVYLNAILGFGFHQTDASRAVIVGTTTSTATSDYDTYNINTAIEAGKAIPLSSVTTLIPFAGVDYSHSNRDDFTETGAGTANLRVNDEDEDSLRTKLGLRLSHDITTGNGIQVTPTASVAYVREMMDSVSRLEAGFTAVPTSTFLIDGADLDRDRVQVGFGVTGQLNERTTLNVAYNGELADSDDNHSFSATIRLVW